jgi:hypothetical protein
MRIPIERSWRTSTQYLKMVALHLKEMSSSKIHEVFGSAARPSNPLDELHGAMIGSAIKFATGVSTWGTTFVHELLEPSYEELFQLDIELSSRSYFNQLLLAIEAACFFLHALNRLLERFGSEEFKKAIYDSSRKTLISWWIEVAVSALGRDSDSVNEEAFDALIKRRDLEYAKSPTLLGSGYDDQDGAVWMAARTISDEVSIKDSFDREGYPNHAILVQIVGTVLIMELEALVLTARIQRVSLATASRELGACFAPIIDRPQQLIDNADSSGFSMQRCTGLAKGAANKIPVSIRADTLLEI